MPVELDDVEDVGVDAPTDPGARLPHPATRDIERVPLSAPTHISL
jgi:hypothetical protein